MENLLIKINHLILDLNHAKPFTGAAGYYGRDAGLFPRTGAAETGLTVILMQVNI